MKNDLYLVDSNVLINLNRGDTKIAELIHGKTLLYSIITEIELLSYPEISPAEIIRVKAMLSECLFVGIDDEVKQQAIAIRRHTKMKLPDAVVVATALCTNVIFDL